MVFEKYEIKGEKMVVVGVKRQQESVKEIECEGKYQSWPIISRVLSHRETVIG